MAANGHYYLKAFKGLQTKQIEQAREREEYCETGGSLRPVGGRGKEKIKNNTDEKRESLEERERLHEGWIESEKKLKKFI